MKRNGFLSRNANNLNDPAYRDLLTAGTERWANSRPMKRLLPLKSGEVPTLEECCAFAATMVNQSNLPTPPIEPFHGVKGPTNRHFFDFQVAIPTIEKNSICERLWEPEDVTSYVWEMVLDTIEGAYKSMQPCAVVNSKGPGNVKSGLGKKIGAKAAAKELDRLRVKGDQFQPYAFYSRQLGCCRTTIFNAVHSSQELMEWAQVGEFKRNGKPREQPLSDGDLDTLRQSTEIDPAVAVESLDSRKTECDPDLVLEALLENCANESQLEGVSAMSKEQLRKIGELYLDTPGYGADDEIEFRIRTRHGKKS